ncbi:MAG: hypothetical protein FWE34_04375 [Defluviitaleaceae bacterium]|nr:hypothetical protein [Defluviitaleaceae bacterium]
MELVPSAVAVDILAAFLGISVYFICWMLSKYVRAFILVAFIIFSIDTILFVVLIGIAGVLCSVTDQQLEEAKTAVDNEIASVALGEVTKEENKEENK